jgi:hypothetical protein
MRTSRAANGAVSEAAPNEKGADHHGESPRIGSTGGRCGRNEPGLFSCRASRRGVRCISKRNYPMPYQQMSVEQAQDIIRKEWPTVRVPKPITRDNAEYDLEDAAEDQKRMYREITEQAPWLTPQEAYARLKLQIAARAQSRA